MKILKTFARFDESKGRIVAVTTSKGARYIASVDAAAIRNPHPVHTRNGAYIWAESRFAPVLGGDAVPHCARVFRAVEYQGTLLMTVKDSGLDTLSIIGSVADFQHELDKYVRDPRWLLMLPA